MSAITTGFECCSSCTQVNCSDEFLQGSDTPRKRDEGVGALEHQPLALMHVADNEAFLNFRQEMFPVH